MKYFSLLTIAGVLLFTACKNGNNAPKSAKEILEEAAPNMNAGAGKFTIDGPKEWKRIDTTLNGVKSTILLAPEETGGFRANINVVTENMGKDSLQTYFDKTVSSMEKYLGKFTVAGKGDKDINGIPSKWLKYTAEQGGMQIAAILYIVPKNGVAYGITGTTKAGEGDKYFTVFDNTVSTFKVAE
ncbi:DUF1795 domain-containing protein [Chitinophaga filiformis]|uniref:DUF1795 domain-containing protein n=1 Tax=Chitinophaga filiformis TaxID=104663 RepID=A0ABY4HX03_CHIFI|nr:DUF1795 domain-containing protein [Chitinophaga filiformis]UPK67574.1 DUF1795 domain-containing protein [Chitinophaga filiformis]